jgi:SSS family solute:Na+ symporter
MSSLDALSVTNSALFIRNLYQPLRPGKPERHYINVGRAVIGCVLIGGVFTALFVDNLLDLFKYFISIPAVFGAAVWLGFTWRRLTRWAVIIQVFLCFTIYAVVPNAFQAIDAVRANEAFLVETEPREVEITTGALAEDVEAGRAEAVGQSIRKKHVIEPTGVFFEHVVRSDPSDPGSPLVGEGRFHAEIWILSRLGIDFTRCSKAQLVAVRFFFDALFPFVLLFVLSMLTRPVDKKRLDRFFARIHTPVQPSAEEEERAIAHAAEHPEIVDARKIVPGSSWEILRPGRWDILGFGGSWVLVGFIVFLLWLVANIGS